MESLFEDFINHFSVNQNFSQQTKFEIIKHLSLVNFKKKHILINENQRHNFAYFVVKGAVRSYYLKDGIEVNTWFAFENDIVGSLYNFKDLPSRESIELVENSTLISINIMNIKSLMLTNIQVANFINAILEEYALFLEDKVYYSQMMTSMEKYKILIEREPQIFQRIPLTYIASFLGISRETLSRLRAK